MTWFTHVNRGVIDSNRKHGRSDPPVSFRDGKRGKAVYAKRVRIEGPVDVVYSDGEPILPCGARLVIESEAEPVVVA